MTPEPSRTSAPALAGGGNQLPPGTVWFDPYVGVALVAPIIRSPNRSHEDGMTSTFSS